MSFSAFHHVPNPEQVLAEMFRVLKPGGIVGFVEPGMGHSSAPQSQLEMSYFKVLENDIDLKTLVYTAQKLGFSSPRFRVCTNPIRDIYPDDYFELHNHGKVPSKLTQALRNDTRQNYIFFFTKGVSHDPSNASRIRGYH